MSIKSTALNTIRALTEISNQYQIEEKIINISEEIRKNSLQGKFTLIFGNGGSAADAQHFAGELVCTYKSRKRNPYKAMALTKNVVKALNYAKNNNITTCLISGDNKLEFEDYDFMIKIPSKDTATIQTVTQVIYHSICDVLEV